MGKYKLNAHTGKPDIDSGIAGDEVPSFEMDPLSLHLDQTTPQTIVNGVPLMTTAVDVDGSGSQLVNKDYVDLAVSSLHLSEYFSASALSPAVGTFLSMSMTPSSAGTVQSVDITGTVGSPTEIFKWMTPVGEPYLDRIPAGSFDIHAHLKKTTTAPNNKIAACYAEIWQNDAAGAHIAKIATSSTFSGFEITDKFYDIYATVSTEFPLDVTDRISIEFFGYVISGLGENKITMTVGGTEDSHMGIGVSASELFNTCVKKTATQTIKVDGDFYGMYRVSATKKISPPDLGYGYTITNVKVQCASADPTTEFAGDLKWCDAQGTGAFPSTNPTVIKVLDTTTGNYDSGAITEDVATGKELYIQMDSATDYGVMWTITITYALKTS